MRVATQPRLEWTQRGRLLLALVGLTVAAAWLTGDPHARLAASLLVAPLLADWLFKTRRLGQLRIEMSARRTEAGRTYLERLEVANESHGALQDVAITEPLTATYRGTGLVATLAPNESVELRLPARSRRRSHLVERILVCESRWPLGFLRRRATYVIASDLVTEPARLGVPIEAIEDASEGRPDVRLDDRRGGLEFFSLREYRDGEDARTVHALRSARIGTIVRRELRGQYPQEAAVVLDLRRTPGRSKHAVRRRFERGLSTCASLLDTLEQRVGVVHVLVLAETRRYERLAAPADYEDFLTFLAEVEVADTPADAPDDADDRLAPFHDCTTCYWVPAAGDAVPRDLGMVGGRVIVLGTEGP